MKSFLTSIGNLYILNTYNIFKSFYTHNGLYNIINVSLAFYISSPHLLMYHKNANAVDEIVIHFPV